MQELLIRTVNVRDVEAATGRAADLRGLVAVVRGEGCTPGVHVLPVAI